MRIGKLLFWVLMMCPLAVAGQEADKGALRAEQVFSLLLKGPADSLYTQLSEKMQAALTPAQLTGLMPQLEQMAGAYKEHGDWKRVEGAADFLVYASPITFEQGQFSMTIAFDDAYVVQGMHIVPVLAADDKEPLTDTAIELDDTVRTGDVALPAKVVLSGQTASPPIVVLVHGSGALDRDETVMANKPFRDLTYRLAEQGISTLRYDKRTFAYRKPVDSMEDETIADALSAIALARTYNSKVYLLGHSLGAMLAPIIASRAALAGIVMMAAPARDLPEVVREQMDYLSDAETTAQQKAEAIDKIRQQSPHYFQPQHQVEAACGLNLPMLILQGERDYQVTMTDFRLWQEALKNKENVAYCSYPSLNHLFLEGEGKSTPQEYMKKGSMPQQVIDDIARFINRHSTPQQ